MGEGACTKRVRVRTVGEGVKDAAEEGEEDGTDEDGSAESELGFARRSMLAVEMTVRV